MADAQLGRPSRRRRPFRRHPREPAGLGARARECLRSLFRGQCIAPQLPAAAARVDFTRLSWAKAGTIERDYLDANRPALELWRKGTERPDALFHQPDSLKLDSILAIGTNLGSLSRLAFLEASRLEETGQMGDAWSWYKAILRSSRHVGKRGIMFERVTGAYMHRNAAWRIIRWAGDPRVDAALCAALDDTLTAEALTPPLSENMKLDYLMCIRDLIELRVTVDEIPLPGGRQGLLERIVSSRPLRTEIQRARLHATNDVDRSRRVLNLLYANWLAQVDKAAGLRAPMAARLPFVIYAADPSAPAAARAIASEKLIAAVRQTLFAQEYVQPNYWKSQGGAVGRRRLGGQGSPGTRAPAARGAGFEAGGRAVSPRARQATGKGR